MKLMPKTTFFTTGLALWALGGCIISMACFEPTATMDQIQANKELAKEVGNAWQSVSLKVGGCWALAGGILGLVIFLLFSIRPSHEHYTRVPMAPMPGMYGAPSGPRTIAELNAGFQSWILGVIIGFCGVIFLLPRLQNELIVIKHSFSTIMVIGGIMALVTTVPIIPFSLKRLSKAYDRGCRE